MLSTACLGNRQTGRLSTTEFFAIRGWTAQIGKKGCEIRYHLLAIDAVSRAHEAYKAQARTEADAYYCRHQN